MIFFLNYIISLKKVDSSWRWGQTTYVIITPVQTSFIVLTILYCIFIYNWYSVSLQGLWPSKQHCFCYRNTWKKKMNFLILKGPFQIYAFNLKRKPHTWFVLHRFFSYIAFQKLCRKCWVPQIPKSNNQNKTHLKKSCIAF